MKRGRLIEYAVVAVVAIALALLVQAFLVKPYRIPSGSMASTLRPGDRVLVNRVVYRLREPWSLARPFTVPADSYFVMGDNRTDSDDSRFWGTVPRVDIIGEGFIVYWPLGRWGAL